jgi:cation transport ATPase
MATSAPAAIISSHGTGSAGTFLLAGRFYEARARRMSGEAMRELAAISAKDACVSPLP